MKTAVRLSPVIICSLIMAAHLFRGSMFIFMAISLLIPFLLIWKNKISVRIVQFFLILYGMEWIRTIVILVNIRMENGEDWMRMTIILGVVALLNFLCTLVFLSNHLKTKYHLV